MSEDFVMKLVELVGVVGFVLMMVWFINLLLHRRPSDDVQLLPILFCEDCGRMLYKEHEFGEFYCLSCDEEEAELGR